MKNHLVSRLSSLLIMALVLGISLPTFAKPGERNKEGKAHGDRMHQNLERELMRELVPPQMALRFQDKLQLSDSQRSQLQDLVQSSRDSHTEARETLRHEVGRLRTLLADQNINTDAAMAQAEKVFELETEIKRARLEQMIRAKQVLTPEQVAQVSELRKEFGRHKQGKMKRQRNRQ